MARLAVNHESKKRELLAIAEKLFLEKGYEQTSIDDILRESGISKGGFYHYFKSKDDILSESINIIIEDAILYLQPIVEDKNLNALEKFKLFMVKKSEFQASKKEYAALLGKLLQTDIMQYKYNMITSQKMIIPFATILEQGVKEGVFHVDFPLVTADILIRAISSVTQSIYYDDYLHDDKMHQQYQLTLQSFIARVLGISQDEIM